MAGQQRIESEQRIAVRLANDDEWIQLGFGLGCEFTGGELVRLAEGATVAVEAADELSASYRPANWLSGVASGALYAFRTLRMPRQCVVLTELSRRLRAGDMDAVANGAAIGVAELAAKELPKLPTDGWTIEAQLGDRSPASAVQPGAETPAA